MELNSRPADPLPMLDRLLYPASLPFDRGYLGVGSGHEIYYEQSGAQDGTPIVLVHGGPGSGSSPLTPRFLDPAFFRIVSFDQRGAGRSRPAGSLKANTTENLVGDMETLRKHLDIGSWVVCGGSWGATLALAYGISHSARCLGFLLRSVCLGRKAEYCWWENGMRSFFPESWRRFAEHVAGSDQEGLLAAYGKRLSSSDEKISGPAAIEWHRYSASCGSLLPTESRKLQTASLSQLVHMARIESHYFLHNAFLPDGWILKGARRLKHLPATIVHGRYDVICPPESAYDLAGAWPAAKLRIVEACGHQPTEHRLAKAFLEEAEGLKNWYPNWPNVTAARTRPTAKS